MSAIRYQNISLYSKRGKIAFSHFETFLQNNNIEYTLVNSEDADLSKIRQEQANNSITFPALVYESVKYERGAYKVSDQEYSLTVDDLPSNFANVAVKTS